MFPTLYDIFSYILNIHIHLPIQTFGFFVALSFLFTYLAFVSEFKRKEALGLIHAFTRRVVVGKPASVLELLVNAVLGFLLGYKIIGALLDYTLFIFDPQAYLLSAKGNLLAGLLFGIGWCAWAWYDRHKAQLQKPEVVDKIVHPYQLMVRITFWCGFFGFIGAKLFDTAEHISYFLADPVRDLLSTNGFTYYGGFLFGMLTFFYIGTKNGMKLAHVSDVGAPGIMLAYGIGRIGCQLSGDGDWGIVNSHIKPGWLQWAPGWMWSYRFPHNIADAGVYMQDCITEHCYTLPHGVYPTSFYESVICLLMFAFLWGVRKHIHTAGLMSFVYLVLIGVERFFIEFIRVTIRYNIFGSMLSQAQVLSALMFFTGLGGLLYLYFYKRQRYKKTLQ